MMGCACLCRFYIRSMTGFNEGATYLIKQLVQCGYRVCHPDLKVLSKFFGMMYGMTSPHLPHTTHTLGFMHKCKGPRQSSSQFLFHRSIANPRLSLIEGASAATLA